MRAWLFGILVLVWAAGAVARQGPADALWPLFRDGELEEVVRRGKALLNTGTETAQVNLAVGRALAALDRCDEAGLFLARAAELDPDRTWVHAWAHYDLGVCAWARGDAGAARRHWIVTRDAAATANATRAAVGALNGFGLAERFDRWTRFTSEHFVFRFSDRLTDLDRTDFARRREAAYAEISAWFGGGPDAPIRFFVWSDQEEATAAGMPPLGFARPEHNLVHSLARQTVGHEMTHVIAAHALAPKVVTGLINEGTAVHFDRTGRDQLARARRAIAATAAVRVDLAALWRDWSLLPPEVSYPLAGAWVVRLLDEGGRERFLRFFPDQSLDHAREIYGDDLEGWMAAFDEDVWAQSR